MVGKLLSLCGFVWFGFGCQDNKTSALARNTTGPNLPLEQDATAEREKRSIILRQARRVASVKVLFLMARLPNDE